MKKYTLIFYLMSMLLVIIGSFFYYKKMTRETDCEVIALSNYNKINFGYGLCGKDIECIDSVNKYAEKTLEVFEKECGKD